VTTAAEHPAPEHVRAADDVAPAPAVDVTVTRTATGWSVIAPTGVDEVGDLLEGMTLADLVTEELGGSVDPDRSARRSARGPAVDAPTASGEPHPAEARIAALERTVAQLEHALAARVSTERAIGVLAERHGTCPRDAFESLRRSARKQGRAVVELAREVLDGLATDDAGCPSTAAAPREGVS
jgi:hypothetical protein